MNCIFVVLTRDERFLPLETRVNRCSVRPVSLIQDRVESDGRTAQAPSGGASVFAWSLGWFSHLVLDSGLW